MKRPRFSQNLQSTLIAIGIRWYSLSERARFKRQSAINDTVQEFGKAFETGEPQKFMNEFLEHKRKAKG